MHSENKISCLSHSNLLLGVGLETGTLMVYCCNVDMQHLTQLHIVFNDLVSSLYNVMIIISNEIATEL